MYKNRNESKNNICGKNIKKYRLSLNTKTSQHQLAIALCKEGLVLDKNAIQKIEAGQRFVTDIELVHFANFFHVSADELLNNKESQ